MQGFEATAVYHVTVFQIVGILSLFGDEFPSLSGRRPCAGAKGLLPAVRRSDAFVCGVV